MSVQTYAARYRLFMGDSWREPGELVPEAHLWFRVESYLHQGRIVEVEVSDDEFRQAVQRYCPQQAERVATFAGVPEDVVLVGPHKTPRRTRKAKVAEEPAPVPEPIAEPEPVPEPSQEFGEPSALDAVADEPEPAEEA